MNFGEAIEALKQGQKIRRGVWDDGTWLQFVRASAWSALDGKPLSNYVECPPWIGLKTANHFVPWVASHIDILAEDWSTVDVGAPSAYPGIIPP